MKRILAIIIFISATVFSGVAHNTKIATFTLRDTGAGWYIEMNFAEAGVKAAMIEEHGKQTLSALSEERYKALILDYAKSNFQLTVDKRRIKLGDGGIMLGPHQTDLKFMLPGLPLRPSEAQIRIPMFGSTYDHTNLFRIYRGGKNISKFYLNDDNDFSVALNFTAQGVVVVQEESSPPSFVILGTSGMALGLWLSFTILAKKKFGR